MNRQFKTDGLILRKSNLNDADQILTVLTRDRGKISCIAKGCRRLKSRFCGRLEILYEVRLAGFEGRELAHLDEVELLDARSLLDCGLTAK
ncbi:DNA repair protein RecO, partial [Candidatus Peregrinibacteria bacterium]|nr:DNA repair protein RecO [Candidatus Peregrinibacteria bacterium]